MVLFKKITIIGLGLIGSSLARVIREKGLAETLVAADVSSSVCDKVRDLTLADEVIADVSKSVMGSDLVILATPVGAYEEIAQKIAPALKPGAIVTDVGSVKAIVLDSIVSYLPESVHFVPGHPIAGTEYSGPESGFSSLFEGRWCLLTPLPDTDIRAVEKVTALWEAAGAVIEIMDAERHDLILGITSHLPHLIAYTIVGTANELEDEIKADVIKFSASGFRGFTRIAASDPTMWRDVFLNNKGAVLEILQRFTEDLTAMQKAIRRGDGTYLHDVFTHTRAIRREIMELGEQGYASPIQQRQE